VEEARKARRRELARKRRAEKKAQVEEEMRIKQKEEDEKIEKEEEAMRTTHMQHTREKDLKRMEELQNLAERLAARLLKGDEELPQTTAPYIAPEPLPPGYVAGHVHFKAPSSYDFKL
jgi:ATPase subunit of ABC transporter with duplicated ATPase domains